MEKPVCPHCSSCDIVKNPLDHRCLSDTLFMVSCLFSAAFISYAEALQRINHPTNLSHHQAMNNLKTTSADMFILQSACEQSKNLIEIYLHAALMGPIKLSSKESSNQEITNDCSTVMTRYENWFKVLILAACCLQRIFRQSTLVHHRCYNKSTNQLMKRLNKSPFYDLKLYMTKVKITNDWWPVLMNMLVCGLRGMWLECISSNHQDESIHLKFDKLLDQCLSIIFSNPLDCLMTTTTTIPSMANNSTGGLNLTLYLLNDTNEFQLFKLLALYSQSSPLSSLQWANKLCSLQKWRDSQERILPVETLFFHQKNMKISTGNEKFQFSLTCVCLARSIEMLLHYQTSQHHHHHHQVSEEMPSVQFCLDLLRTSNEYLAISLEEFKSFSGSDKAKYLDIVNNVLKQVLRNLPSDLTLYSSTSNDTVVNKEILRIFVNLRLHQLNLMLLRHHHGVTFKRGKSQTPAWSTMITQTRNTLDWHSSYLATLSCKEDKPSHIDIQDVILHVTLLSHLVNLQTVNQSVLSVLGIQTILQDIYRIRPILTILTDCSGCLSPDTHIDLQGPLNSISHNLGQLCDTLVRKSQCKRENKSERKSVIIQNRKKNKQKHKKPQQEATDTTSRDEGSPESLLLSHIKYVDNSSTLESDDKETRDQHHVPISNCQAMRLKIEHLAEYLSGL
ncbi:unnamed protein product [Heterobilharzia americana]|nr:unnamed protein product [Heterobilharzia americana]